MFFDVDPATLRVPHERIDGADPAKLQRQIARHGKSLTGMPPVLVYKDSDGELMLSDGVTHATRAAKPWPPNAALLRTRQVLNSRRRISALQGSITRGGKGASVHFSCRFACAGSASSLFWVPAELNFFPFSFQQETRERQRPPRRRMAK